MRSFRIIAFKLGDEAYGIKIEQVLSVERQLPITRVPNAPLHVKGVINLRGTIIPVIDLQEKLGLGTTPVTRSTQIMMTTFNEIELGLLVDQTTNVMECFPEAVESAASAGLSNDHFEGIYKVDGHFIILLNMEELTRTANLEENQAG
ncbi:chemotaxis protein CheW [Pullulanibacillus sp. KACC 23026]|uniref:chemotaxis protein CheW n=1 Tax=Pullulanibacillus sp. KACC 23026 TaxID=3028315 RepID=UPI0023B01FF5|nr:chemotaxis protein CheW [Pullulanibacillus sp. KACC 23026]WEG11260.1 chemotaxis protein CheW [Pullulanibacillus sp. KACC 23026]